MHVGVCCTQLPDAKALSVGMVTCLASTLCPIDIVIDRLLLQMLHVYMHVYMYVCGRPGQVEICCLNIWLVTKHQEPSNFIGKKYRFSKRLGTRLQTSALSYFVYSLCPNACCTCCMVWFQKFVSECIHTCIIMSIEFCFRLIFIFGFRLADLPSIHGDQYAEGREGAF